jgi:hypothetical protein
MKQSITEYLTDAELGQLARELPAAELGRLLRPVVSLVFESVDVRVPEPVVPDGDEISNRVPRPNPHRLGIVKGFAGQVLTVLQSAAGRPTFSTSSSSIRKELFGRTKKGGDEERAQTRRVVNALAYLRERGLVVLGETGWKLAE